MNDSTQQTKDALGLTQDDFAAIMACTAAFAEECMEAGQTEAAFTLAGLLATLDSARHGDGVSVSGHELALIGKLCTMGARRLRSIQDERPEAKEHGDELTAIANKLAAFLRAQSPETAAAMAQPVSEAVH